jgi:hypothetical protein
MKQSKLMSWLETCLNTGIGFAIAITAQILVFPLFGFNPPLSTNFKIALIFTVVSIVRGYVLRRAFEALHIRRPLSAFTQAVIAEVYRQREVEGYDAAHDAQHTPRELARAGAAYLLGGDETKVGGNGVLPQRFTGFLLWPWDRDSWKPRELRRDLVRGCALGISAGELADRNRTAGRGR